MVSARPLKAMILLVLAVMMINSDAGAQTAIDTLRLELVPPDSISAYRRGGAAVIRWYPGPDSVTSLIGSLDLRNWYSGYDPADISQVTYYGSYTGTVDRTIKIEREVSGGTIEPTFVGTDPFISLRIETIDPINRTYAKRINIGTNYYTPGNLIPMRLINQALESDTLDLGFDISFSAGIIDTSLIGGPAQIEIDLQDFEGFHVWRGSTPYPEDMISIIEISKEDYFLYSDISNAGDIPVKYLWLWNYFRDTDEPAWPRYDAQGREYYEWVDNNVYPGFTYYYHVTCFDRGYFKGFFEYNKKDNFICDSGIENPEDPLSCEQIAQSIVMTVDAGGDSDGDMENIYAVPNPYRTGTSEESSLAYHNYDDRCIKFFNVPKECSIEIFTVAGDLVWKSSHSSLDGSDGMISWPVKNMHNKDVSSGVYVYKIESSSGGSWYGKLVVIR